MEIGDNTLFELLEGRDAVLSFTTTMLIEALVCVHDLTRSAAQLLVLIIVGHLKMMRIDNLSRELGEEHRTDILEKFRGHTDHLGDGLRADKLLLLTILVLL